MKRAIIIALIAFLIPGCASTFKEKRELSRPLVSLAMGMIQRDEIQSALIELRRAERANPSDPQVYYGLAIAYWKSDKLDKALENADKAISLGDNLGLEHPGLKSEANNLKGIILTSQGKQEQAIEAFQAALKDELYATPEFALHNLSSLYLDMKKYTEAQKAASQALDYNSHYAPAWEVLGRIFIEQQMYPQAVDTLNHAILEFPGYTEAHWELAQLYLRMGNTDEAMLHLEQVVELNPEGPFGSMAQQRLRDLKRNP